MPRGCATRNADGDNNRKGMSAECGHPFSVQTDAGARREKFFSEASGLSAGLRAVVGPIAAGAARPIAGTGRRGSGAAVAAVAIMPVAVVAMIAPVIVAAVITSVVVTAVVVAPAVMAPVVIASAIMAAVIVAVVVASAVMAAAIVAAIVMAAVIVTPVAVIVPPVLLRFVAFIVVFLPTPARRGIGQSRRGDKHGRQRQHKAKTQYTKQSCHKILAYEGIVRDSHSILFFCGCVQTGR